MVKTETKHYCETCGESFDNLKRAKIHELRPLKISDKYQGLIFRQYGSTHLVLADKNKLDSNHQNCYLIFSMTSNDCEQDVKFISDLYTLEDLETWLHHDSFKQDLEFGKKFWKNIQFYYKNIQKGEVKKLVESLSDLELKVLEK
jgi:hypothetical protein